MNETLLDTTYQFTEKICILLLNEFKERQVTHDVIQEMKCYLLKRISNQGLENEKRLIQKINDDEEYRRELSDKCGITGTDFFAEGIKKENGHHLKYTDSFQIHKQGTGETSPSAKTDIVLRDKTTKEILCKISLKSGDGRPTSADMYETNALLQCVYESNTDDSILKDKIDKIVQCMKGTGKHKSIMNKGQIKKLESDENTTQEDKDSIQWLEESDKNILTAYETWKDIYEDHQEFSTDVIKECLSGHHKFGDNCGSADFLMITKSSKSVDIDTIFNLRESSPELVSYCRKKGKPIPKTTFAIKSSRPRRKGAPYTLWARFL